MNRALDIFRNALWQLADEQPRRQPAPMWPDTSFDSSDSISGFRYSYTEISAHGGAAHVKRRETRLENGRFVTEECEGTLDRAAYDRMAEQTQQYFFEQMERTMRMFFPFSSSGRKTDE